MADGASGWAAAELRGVPISELIAQPLEAIIRAQTKMAVEQVDALLRYCFKRTEEQGRTVYDPVMLVMKLRRAYLRPGRTPKDPPTLDQVETEFYVPVLTIFPMSGIAVNSVNIDFGVEVLVQYRLEKEPPIRSNGSKGGKDKVQADDDFPRRSVTLGRIATRAPGPFTNVPGANGAKGSTDFRLGATYNIDVEAGPVPLPNGLLSIISLYTKAIEPVSMPTEAGGG